MKQCRDGWSDKCIKIYDDEKDFAFCPYCGSAIVWSMPYKQFFENTRSFFGANTTPNALKLINELEKNHHIINVKITEITKFDEAPTWYSATLTFEVTTETNIDKLFMAMHKYTPDEFDKITVRSEIRPKIEIYRMWWD